MPSVSIAQAWSDLEILATLKDLGVPELGVLDELELVDVKVDGLATGSGLFMPEEHPIKWVIESIAIEIFKTALDDCRGENAC